MKYQTIPLVMGMTSLNIFAADIPVTANITSDTTWTAANTYIIDKPIFITNSSTLTIEPGTLILGAEGNGSFGSLIATRGSKLIADGTAEEPIVFTAREERDGIDGVAANKPNPADGDASYWGGVILLGNAQVNRYEGGSNQGVGVIEGFPNAGDTSLTTYGGTNNADNSGVLRYVSIRFGGFEFAANNEINGLTLGGVGSGTVIENVEVISNSDDGVEFFGGTVNTKRIAVAFCQDESFDIDQGHDGYHQFWFAIQNAEPLLGDFGGEWDGGNGDNVNGAPFTKTHIYNLTMIGTGAGTTGSVDDGINLSDNFAGTLANSLVHDFNGAALTNVGDGVNNPKPVFNNNTWGMFGGGAGIVPSIGGAGPQDPAGSANSSVGTDPMLGGISRIPNGGLDPRPNQNSPLYQSPLAEFPASAPEEFYETVNYRGAFGATNWLNGWSYLSKAGYLGDLAEVPDNDPLPAFADTDGDGLSDFLEDRLVDYGFDKSVSNSALVAAFFENERIYNETSMLDLRTSGQVVVQADGNDVTLSLPVEKSDDLGTFTPAGFLQLTLPKELDKQFYRLRVEGAQ